MGHEPLPPIKPTVSITQSEKPRWATVIAPEDFRNKPPNIANPDPTERISYLFEENGTGKCWAATTNDNLVPTTSQIDYTCRAHGVRECTPAEKLFLDTNKWNPEWNTKFGRERALGFPCYPETPLEKSAGEGTYQRPPVQIAQ